MLAHIPPYQHRFTIALVLLTNGGIPWLSGQLPSARWTAKCPELLCPAGALPRLGLVWRIFAGYCQFLLRVGPSRRYLRETLLGCLDLCHGGIRSALARYFLHIVGLPQRVMGRLPTNFHPMTPWWALFSRLQSFLNVQTSKLACHPGHPYRNGIPIGQPWRLHPGRTCVVTSTCTGYAIRPKRAIDGRGLSPHKSHSLVGYSYPLQRTERVRPARCPGRVLLWQVPFGQTASLHLLRHRLPGFVRRRNIKGAPFGVGFECSAQPHPERNTLL